MTRSTINDAIKASGLEVVGWREVPIEPSVCGEQALQTLPRIEQVFVNAPSGMQRGTFNRQLFLARRRAEKRLGDNDPATYVASLSSVTINYKGMVMPGALADFYPDLRDPAHGKLGLPVSPALLDQHVAAVAPRAAVPFSRAQRRDQYDPGQSQLGPGA